MNIKRGDSFMLALVVKVDGVIQDLTNWQIRSSIENSAGFAAPLTVEITDRAAGAFKLTADTADWPTGSMMFDVRYVTDAGQVITTDSVAVSVTKGVTL